MHITSESPSEAALSIEKSALMLGLDEFSLHSRIQAGQINAVRARSGEMMIPESELERLVLSRLRPSADESSGQRAAPPDHRLGIEGRFAFRGADRPMFYRIPGLNGRITENEASSYRAAFGAVADELESVRDMKKQLKEKVQYSQSYDFEVNTPQNGRWEICSALLNLPRGEVLLCQQGNEFAIIEKFQGDSLYAQVNGDAEILRRGHNARQLTEEYKADAKHTLAFMASNLTAKAQKIVWEQFPGYRPGDIMAAISERCHEALTNAETISQSRKFGQNISRGVSI